MIKKLILLAGVAAAAVIARQKLEQGKSEKDLWAQASDQPTGQSTQH